MVASGHRGFDYDELLTATLALQARGDAVRDQPRPDPADAGRRLAGDRLDPRRDRDRLRSRAEIGGKPERHLFELARERIPAAGRVAMVGDRIASDIEGGQRAGLETILVLTGASTREEAAAASTQPDHVVDDLSALLR